MGFKVSQNLQNNKDESKNEDTEGDPPSLDVSLKNKFVLNIKNNFLIR